MITKKLFTGLSIGLLLVCPITAHATLTTYADRTAFNLAAGSSTLIDFEAQLKSGSFSWYGSNLTVGDASFT